MLYEVRTQIGFKSINRCIYDSNLTYGLKE